MHDALKPITVIALLVLALMGITPIQALNQPKNHYEVDAHIDVAAQTLEVSVSIDYNRDVPTDYLELLVHEQAELSSWVCTCPYAEFRQEPKGNKIKSLIWQLPDTTTQMSWLLSYKYTFTEADAPWGIDRITKDWIELSLNSGWLPIIATYDNQFTAELVLTIEADLQFKVLSSGTTKTKRRNKFKIKNTTPQIDLVLIGSPRLDQVSEGPITLYEFEENKLRQSFIFHHAASSYQWLNTTFGAVKKLAPPKLVITPRTESGYARKNLIVLSNDINTSDTLHFVNYITHEFAHYWSTGANPLTAHRWLDESVAEYIAWKYIELTQPQALTKFLDEVRLEASKLPAVYHNSHQQAPAHGVMYRKGVLRLFQLEQQIGAEGMFSFLSQWFQIKVKDTEQFLDLLSQLQGAEIANTFRELLAKE